MINAIQIALSGLAAASKKVETAAQNIANQTTEGALEGGEGSAPYNAQTVTQQAAQGGGVRAQAVPKNPPFVPSYHPDSPFADSDGLTGAPNVDLAEEAVSLSLAKIEYKANLKIIEAANELSDDLLGIFDDRA